MDRRDFLGTGVALSALALTRCSRPTVEAPATAEKALQLGSWESVREQFALAPDLVHMSSFFLASHPRPVREAIEAHRRGLDANPYQYIEENIARFETEVRTSAAGYMNAKPDELAMTDSTSMGLGVVYGGLELREGQEILTTTHDHVVTHVALEQRAARSGNAIRKVTLYDQPQDAKVDEMVSRLEKALTPATRVIALTWVHSGTGVKLPIRAIASAVEHANAGRDERDRALIFVDGVHGFGNQDVSIPELGCDFFISGCHKWILGPRGTGVVWARPGAWPATRPTIPSMDPMWRRGSLDSMPLAAFMTPGGFHSFEHRWALSAAFELHQQVGRAKIAERIETLGRRCKEGLARLPKVRLRTPLGSDVSASIICFEVDPLKPQEVVDRLRKKNIVASVTPSFYVPPYVRLAPSLVTLERDVDRAIEAVATL